MRTSFPSPRPRRWAGGLIAACLLLTSSGLALAAPASHDSTGGPAPTGGAALTDDSSPGAAASTSTQPSTGAITAAGAPTTPAGTPPPVAGPGTLTVARRTVDGRTESIVVDGHGVTVYELGGESLAHLECTTHACLTAWQPVEVASAARPRQVTDLGQTLAVLHRPRGGFYQLMLDGHPLYYDAADRDEAGRASGEDVAGFGGTWHVVIPGPTL